MRLDGLLAEEQLLRDLRIGLAVEHEHGELELASGQRLERRSGGPARPRALLDSMAELAKLPLRLATVAEGASLPEVVGRTPKLGCGAVTVARPHERASGEQARESGLHRRSGFVCDGRGRECVRCCARGVAAVQL